MSERIVSSLARQLDRRTFLRRAAAGAASVILGLFGLAQPALATVAVKCCNLCYSPLSNCHGNCSPDNIWCWFCLESSTNITWGCCEKFDNATHCANKDFCNSVVYSCLWRTGFAPGQAPAQLGAMAGS